MSTTTGSGNVLSLAAVTAILKDVLTNHLVRHNAAGLIGDVTVSALPPDRLQSGAAERSQLNLFLYRVTPDTRWRNQPAEARASIALDLHYLLTAYSDQDLHVEVLLGYAVQAFHDASVLTPETTRAALGVSGNGSGTDGQIYVALRDSGLIEGLLVRPLEVIPEFLSTEEMSRLWASLQARYQPSLAYSVRSVLVGGTDPAR